MAGHAISSIVSLSLSTSDAELVAVAVALVQLDPLVMVAVVVVIEVVVGIGIIVEEVVVVVVVATAAVAGAMAAANVHKKLAHKSIAVHLSLILFFIAYSRHMIICSVDENMSPGQHKQQNLKGGGGWSWERRAYTFPPFQQEWARFTQDSFDLHIATHFR